MYPPTRGNLLSVQGDADLYQIGRRFSIRYKALLDKYPYDASLYQFTTSAKSRCSQSAYGFSVGFFEGRLAADFGSDTETGVIGVRPLVQPIDISMLPIVGPYRSLFSFFPCTSTSRVVYPRCSPIESLFILCLFRDWIRSWR